MVVFATLTPRNGAAILGFHDAVTNVLPKDQKSPRYARYWSVSNRPVKSRRAAKAQAERDGLGGSYDYDLANPPNSIYCWYVGAGRPDDVAHHHLQGEGVRDFHAVVIFTHDTNKLQLRRFGLDVHDLKANGNVLLNNHTLEDGDVISIGPMTFKFSYTKAYDTAEFLAEATVSRNKPRKMPFGTDSWPGLSTPKIEKVREYTLGSTIAKGKSGDLITGCLTASAGQLVAVKKMEYVDAQHPGRALHKWKTANAVTDLAITSTTGSQYVHRLMDCFAHAGYAYLVYEYVDTTLADIMKEGSQDLTTTQSYTRDMLCAAKFLHSNNFISVGMEPRNIGIVEGRAVLLVIHSTVSCEQDQVLDRDPGGSGPANYVAPEREYTEYAFAADIWSIAVMGVELWEGAHPWPTERNPWQRIPEVVKSRPTAFNKKYKSLMKRLKKNGSPFCLMLVEMLSYDWAEKNVAPRLTAAEALNHKGLQSVSDEEDGYVLMDEEEHTGEL